MRNTPFRAGAPAWLGVIVVLAVGVTAAMGADVALDAVSASGSWTNEAVTGGTDWWTTPTHTTSYTWSGPVAQAGRYEVSVFVPEGVVNATNGDIPEVFYTVVATDGSHRVAVNQKANANKWVVLGTYDFSAGSTAQLHLSPNNFQMGAGVYNETAKWGTDRMYVSYQAPKLVRRADSVLAKPLRRLLVISANPAIRQEGSKKPYCEYHGQAAAPAMATLKVWARSKNYALTEAYDAGWSYLESLALYDAVLLNYETPAFDDNQFGALKAYVQLGGGLAGTHSCINMDWRIARLFGADFTSTWTHPYANYAGGEEPALMLSVTPKGALHPSTSGLLRNSNPTKPQYGAYDEWYCWNNADRAARGDPLLVEASGTLAAKFPTYYTKPHTVSWLRDNDWWKTANHSTSTDPGGGRVWYSSMGHDGWHHFPGTPLANYNLDPVENFTPKPRTLGSGPFSLYEHLTQGIVYAMGGAGQVSILPQIQTPPADLSVAEGDQAEFSVIAGGTSPLATLTYQWQRLSGTTWKNVSNATAATYTIPVAAMANQGTSFRVSITNTYVDADGNTARTKIYSAPVMLTVNAAVQAPGSPVITSATGGPQQIALAWPKVPGATTYTIKSSRSAAGPFTQAGTTSGTPAFTHTGLADGAIAYYTVTAGNSVGKSAASAVVAAKTYTGLESWKQTYFGGIVAAGNAADTADPDRDGMTNLMEYALGTNPTSATSAAPPAVGVVAGKLTLSFFRAQSDVIYYVEGSADLVTWTTLATNPGTVGQTVVAADTAASNSPRRFLRLRVTAN